MGCALTFNFVRRPFFLIVRPFPLALILAACASPIYEPSAGGEMSAWQPPSTNTQLHPVTIVRPSSAGKLATNREEISGSPVAIACATCHSAGSQPAFVNRKGVVKEFHKHVSLRHAGLQCKSCHVEARPDRLHDTSGTEFSILDSMRLCSQCHGLIRRSYDNGAHGGMRGYWDLQRGPRERNDCITCHSPHRPAYPKVAPVAGPKERNARPRRHTASMVEQRYGVGGHE